MSVFFDVVSCRSPSSPGRTTYVRTGIGDCAKSNTTCHSYSGFHSRRDPRGSGLARWNLTEGPTGPRRGQGYEGRWRGTYVFLERGRHRKLEPGGPDRFGSLPEDTCAVSSAHGTHGPVWGVRGDESDALE